MVPTKTVCCYCGVGCGVIVETVQERGKTLIANVRGDPDHPANAGRLCSKGSTLHLSAAPHRYAQTRADRPEIRATRDAPRHAATWDTALDAVADGFARVIERHGPDAVGIYISGQLLTEDYYVFNKLARAVIGTNNIDSNSRLCMSSAVMGYKTTLGADAPPCSYTDLEHAGTVFIAGANPAYAHPIVYRRLEDARARNPALRVIVADPRRTDSASDATLHLPLLPGTDVALFHGMLHVMLDEGLVDHAFIDAHTEGFASLRETVRAWTPAATAQTCGVPAADIVMAARWFAEGPTLSLYCQGLNQSSSGTAKNAALINLHLASAQIGKPGAGPFSLTGQPNAMGGREVGAMATLLSGHRDLGSAADRAAVARLWGVPELPATPGRTAVDMFDALRHGALKAVWIVCTNPAQSLPDQPAVRAALAQAELVVLQEAYAHTATAPFADILLPATTWAEKEGTMTNSERRIARVRAALPPFREARADWAIAADVARRLETRLRPGTPSLFMYSGPEAVWNEHRATTIGRDLDIGGLSWALLDKLGPQQWPFPAGARAGQERLYLDHAFATASGRARFAHTAYLPVAEPTDTRYPFALTTGRLRDQWHGMSRTGTVEQLFAHAAEPCIDLHPGDLAALDVADGDLAHFTSRRGSTLFPVRANDNVRPGQAFMPMHWGEEFVSGTSGRHPAAGVNALTTGARDAKSHQPELKHAAVRILKAELAWHWFVFGFAAPGTFLTLQRALRAFMPSFPYASCVPFGRDRPGLMWRVAAYERPDQALQDRVESMFGIDADSGNVLAYGDIRRGTRRRVKVTEGTLQAVAISGAQAPTRLSAAWLREALESEEPVPMLGRLLLMPGKRSMQSMATAPARGRTICTCVGVDAGSIARWLDAQSADVPAGARLSGLQAALGCGTACGSCVPELKRLAAASRDTRGRPKHLTTSMTEDTFSCARFIKEIGRGTHGARSLSREEAADLYAAMLDGRVDDLELGALLLAYRFKGETADELAGMLDSAQRTLAPIKVADPTCRGVSIPSYNGARKQPNLVPLLALLLARRRIPVLVHGVRTDAGRVTSAEIFAHLGVTVGDTPAELEAALARQHVAFAPIDVLSPAMARLLNFRRRLGVRNSTHTLVKLLQPFETPGLKLVNYTHPAYRESLSALLTGHPEMAAGGALLARGTEGEAVADTRRQVQLDWVHDGQMQTLLAAGARSEDASPDMLPSSRDAATTAEWIGEVLAGRAPTPESIDAQITQIVGVLAASPLLATPLLPASGGRSANG